jgi:hypothetical protein
MLATLYRNKRQQKVPRIFWFFGKHTTEEVGFMLVAFRYAYLPLVVFVF